MNNNVGNRITVLIFICIASLIFSGCNENGVNEQSTICQEEDTKKETENFSSQAIEEQEKESQDAIQIAAEEAQKIKEEAIRTEEAAKKAEEEAKKREEEAKKVQEEAKAEKDRILAEEEAKKAAEEAKIVKEEAEEAKEKQRLAEQKLEEQKNSLSMMSYLAITAENIRISKNNRLVLEDIYTSLLNDINPEKIDETTQDHLQNLRDIIKSYINISTKRERLQFVYNQQKAAAIRSAVPNPLAVLSMTHSLDWKKLAINVVFTVADSFVNYKNTDDSADIEFLMSGWELDDEELNTVQQNRDRAFDYMVDMVQEYELDGNLTLNEKSIEKFAEICAIESVPEKIRRLNSEEATYRALGNYWLELADCYFQMSQYNKCLDCVEQYQKLSTGIFRKDHDYAQILPKAIVAAQNRYTGEQYESVVSNYVKDLLFNTEKSEEYWSLRYFEAQVYLDLYAKTNNKKYLNQAYEIAYDNVTVLLKGQRELNAAYLDDVKEMTVEEPDYRYLTEEEKKEKKKRYKEEKKQAKDYNESLKEARKTELPPVYEPLAVNCELLFALAEEKNISSNEKENIEAILQTSSNGTFISNPVNDAYSFSKTGKYSSTVTKDEIIIPASLLTDESEVYLTVNVGNITKDITDCKIKKVERKGEDIATFQAYISSDEFDKLDWSKDAKLTITIKYDDVYNKECFLNYKVSEYEKHWYGDKVVFEQE